MKITLLQNEIEHAIREHIAKTLDLPETAQIEFDDEDGISAIIDLNPVEGSTNVKPTKRVYKRRIGGEADNAKPAGEPAATGTLVVETPATQVVETSAQQPAQEPAGEAKETPVVDDPVETPNDSPAQATGGEAPVEGEKKSLFGGLKRPVNS